MNAYSGINLDGLNLGQDFGQFGQDIQNSMPSIMNAVRKLKTSDLLEGLGGMSRLNGDMSIGQIMDRMNPDTVDNLTNNAGKAIYAYNENYDTIYDALDSGVSPSAIGDYIPELSDTAMNGFTPVFPDAAADARENIESNIILNNSMDENALVDFFNKVKGPGQLKWLF